MTYDSRGCLCSYIHIGAGRIEIEMLTAIKLLHTLIWAFLAASIVALLVLGMLRRFRWAAILTGLVLLECGVLAVKGGRCPLSDLAARFTRDRASNFDIYLSASAHRSATSRPPKLASSSLHSEPLHEYTQFTVQQFQRETGLLTFIACAGPRVRIGLRKNWRLC